MSSISTVRGGPRGIVTDGLVLNLDAGNSKSYPGFGTTWFDLTNNKNNGNIINGASFSGDGLGSIQFDGINDYVDLGNPSSLNILGTITINSWIKLISFPSTGIWGYIYSKGFDGAYEQYFFRFIYSNTLEFATYTQGGASSRGTVYTINGTISVGIWYNLLSQYDGTNWKIFLNGNLISSTANSGIFSSTAPSTIGADYLNYSGTPEYGRFLNAYISIVQVYNRALSAAEVLQNYNATKTRFGL